MRTTWFNQACSWHQRVPIPWSPPSNLALDQLIGGGGVPSLRLIAPGLLHGVWMRWGVGLALGVEGRLPPHVQVRVISLNKADRGRHVRRTDPPPRPQAAPFLARLGMQWQRSASRTCHGTLMQCGACITSCLWLVPVGKVFITLPKDIEQIWVQQSGFRSKLVMNCYNQWHS